MSAHTTDSELVPCPFCGAPALLVKAEAQNNDPYIMCSDQDRCGICGPGFPGGGLSEQQVIDAWNRRPAASAIKHLRETTDSELVPTDEERRSIDTMRRLARRWPRSLWLFSASGRLHVMRADEDGGHIHTPTDGVDPNYALATIDIPNDGGDW
jgi:hypothetical protein